MPDTSHQIILKLEKAKLVILMMDVDDGVSVRHSDNFFLGLQSLGGSRPHPVTPPGFLMGAAEARATKLSNITDLTVCANMWLAVVLMMCIIYILGAVSL